MSVARRQIMAYCFFCGKFHRQTSNVWIPVQDTRLTSSAPCSFHTIPPFLAQTGTRKPNQMGRDRLWLADIPVYCKWTNSFNLKRHRSRTDRMWPSLWLLVAWRKRGKGGRRSRRRRRRRYCVLCDVMVRSRESSENDAWRHFSAVTPSWWRLCSTSTQHTHTSESQRWTSTCWLVRSYF